MKRFLGTFLPVLVLLWGILLFGGSLILGNFWALLVFGALALTALILAFESQARHTEELEARVRALEEKLAKTRKETTEKQEGSL